MSYKIPNFNSNCNEFIYPNHFYYHHSSKKVILLDNQNSIKKYIKNISNIMYYTILFIFLCINWYIFS